MDDSHFSPKVVLAVTSGAMGIYLLLPNRVGWIDPRIRKIGMGLACLSLVLWVLVWTTTTAEWWPKSVVSGWVGGAFFLLCASGSVAAAGITVTSRQTRSSSLWFVVMLVGNAGLCLLAEAQLAALIAVLISAGAGAAWLGVRALGPLSGRLSSFDAIGRTGTPARQRTQDGQERPSYESGSATRRGVRDDAHNREPFLACLTGGLLVATLIGSIHYAFATEARNVSHSPRRSALPIWKPVDSSHVRVRQAVRTRDYRLLTGLLTVGAAVFSLGTIGVLARPTGTATVLAAAMLVQGAMLTLCGFHHEHGTGQVFALFALSVSVLQAAIATVLRGRV